MIVLLLAIVGKYCIFTNKKNNIQKQTKEKRQRTTGGLAGNHRVRIKLKIPNTHMRH